MLSSQYRLKKKKDIQKVLGKGIMLYGKNINIKFLKSENVLPRFCITTNKKIFKKAVLRNRAKRRIRAALFKIIFEIPGYYDIVIFPQKTILFEKFENLIKEFKLLFLKLKKNE
ncbi:MAG: ribonuclease P protein component [Minisyncoccia bacterium]